MTTINKIIDYTKAITNFDVNELVVKPLKKEQINNSLLDKVPTISSLHSWIKWKLIYSTYVLIILGTLTLCLFFAFIGIYVQHHAHYEGVLIAAIVFAIIFIFLYAFLIVGYGIYQKLLFKKLLVRLKLLIKYQVLINNWQQYPEILQMVNYANEPNTWAKSHPNMPHLTYYGMNIALIYLFTKLNELKKQCLPH